MSRLRTAFLFSVVFLPLAAHASADVTVDYSQLDGNFAPQVYAPTAEPAVTVSELNMEKAVPESWSGTGRHAPIHLHPLTASIATSPTVKNLADEAPSALSDNLRAPIILHPLPPKTLAAMPAPAVQSMGAPVPPITNIDLTMAAVPPAKPVEPAAPQTVASNDVMPPPKAVEPPVAAEKLADMPMDVPTQQPMPSHSDDESGIIPVNAVVNKVDDLNPDDVVGFDYGHADKSGQN